MRPRFVFASALLLAMAAGVSAQVRLARRATAFTGVGPISVISQPPGESRWLYGAALSGSVRVARDGVLLSAPVVSPPNVFYGNESGLLGMAFHPQFQQNGYLYVLYTTSASPAGTRIARYTLDPANPDVADPTSAHTILTINRSPSTNHQAGWIGFGPDGYLYISSGNGGDFSSSQPLTTLLGKVLRIDVDHDDFPADPQKNYAIPPTNPFFGSTTALPEIWAYGLRNPWRCSFDRQTRDLWIADVGDGTNEEVDFQPAIGAPPYQAVNYGYSCLEGSVCGLAGGSCCYSGTSVLPIFEMSTYLLNAIIGGFVYRGEAIPELQGAYMFGGLGGRLYAFRRSAQGIEDFTDLSSLVWPSQVYAFGEDQQGELYLCTGDGAVYKIVRECPANCDGSSRPPILNVNDFVCFQYEFVRGDSYANCDGSTTPPVLNVADFTCFVNQFSAGCPE